LFKLFCHEQERYLPCSGSKMAHLHDAKAPSQNVGNCLGERPCVRQTPIYKRDISGNNMKELLGMGHLAWDSRDPDSGRGRGRGAAGCRSPPGYAGDAARTGVAWDCRDFDQAVASARGRGRGAAGCRGYSGDSGDAAWTGVAWDCRDFDQRGRGLLPGDAAWTGGAKVEAHKLGKRDDATEVWWEAVCDSFDNAPRVALGQRLRGTGSNHCEGRRCGLGPTGGNAAEGVSEVGTPSSPSRIPKPVQRNSFPKAGPVRARAMSATRSPDSTPPSSAQKRAGGYPSSNSSASTPSPAKPARAGSAPVRISRARFDDMPVAPAFGDDSSRKESRFATEYARGGLPCHIDHGTCSNRLTWEISTDEMRARRSTLLALCADGLRETRHPCATIVRLAFADLVALETEGGLEEEDLRKVMAGLRLALNVETSSSCGGGGGVRSTAAATANVAVFSNALDALRQVVAVEGPRIVPHLHLVLPPIGKKMFPKIHREVVQETLRTLERHGGPEAVKVMRRRGVFAGVA